MIEKITDEFACELADLCNKCGEPTKHEIIDRIDGICIGLFGRFQDRFIVEIKELDGSVILYNLDYLKPRPISRIFNKGIIKQRLHEIGISSVKFNVEFDRIQTNRERWMDEVHSIVSNECPNASISEHFTLGTMYQYFIDNKTPSEAVEKRKKLIKWPN